MNVLKILLSPLWLALLIIAFVIRIAIWLVGTGLYALGVLFELVLDLMLIRVFFCIGCVCSVIVFSAMRYANEITWLEWGGFSGAVIALTLFVLYAPTVLGVIGETLKDVSSWLTELVLGIYF